MKIVSEISTVEYLREMKGHLESFTDFGMERLTGIVIGPFFSVTYHSGHEFNRRITDEKHRAIGFARACEDKTVVRCVRLAGMTNPVSLILIYAFCLLFGLLKEPYVLKDPIYLWACVGVTVIAALATAFTSSITERGQLGSKTLTAFLIDPANYYSLINKI